MILGAIFITFFVFVCVCVDFVWQKNAKLTPLDMICFICSKSHGHCSLVDQIENHPQINWWQWCVCCSKNAITLHCLGVAFVAMWSSQLMDTFSLFFYHKENSIVNVNHLLIIELYTKQAIPLQHKHLIRKDSKSSTGRTSSIQCILHFWWQ